MLNICCVKTGTKYGAEYVNILFDMIRRNLPEGTPGRFVCFTDDPDGLSEGIEARGIPSDLKTWWAKLWLFSKDVFREGDRVLYFDLDTVITGPLDKLLDYRGAFAILRDAFDPGIWNSSIMMWRAGAACEIWDKWIEHGRPEPNGGDQQWIMNLRDARINADIIQELYPNKFFSYKKHCFNGMPPRESMVVYFHGIPRPHECLDAWVQNIWKIGGGSANEIELICNTADDLLRGHIASACTRDLPWISQHDENEGHAVIVGGAPSVKDYIEEIKWRKEIGQTIIATNNAFNWLVFLGIEPDAQVIVDAREENVKFIPQTSKATHYLASQCHPSLFDAAKDLNVTLFHSYTEILDSALSNPARKPECFIACGSTVGLTAMGIAYAQGYRMLHIYGMDSSYTDGKHHVYEQPLNDGEIVMDIACCGRLFKASSWMVCQADQFQILLGELMRGGCEATVHGHGLIPWIALNFQGDEAPDTEIVKHDEIYWPSRDEVTRPAMRLLMLHFDRLVRNLGRRGVAIQAGGNVGVVPKELSKYFDKVITFEPNAMNFECLNLNINGNSKIEKHKKALSNEAKSHGMASLARNCGTAFLIEGEGVESITLDSMNLEACDLIQLDIEGSEMNALLGAEGTINKFKPVLCIAHEGLGERYGYSDKIVDDWIKARGYEAKDKILRDVIYTPKEEQPTCWNNRTDLGRASMPAAGER